tara:strand:+ start:359 stop:499 length:141 start_codon:yes stop_codon:yes gene_type:complete
MNIKKVTKKQAKIPTNNVDLKVKILADIVTGEIIKIEKGFVNPPVR